MGLTQLINYYDASEARGFFGLYILIIQSLQPLTQRQ